VGSEINEIAERFLREYMQNCGSVEFHKVVCPTRRYEIHDSHETAVEFLQELQIQFVESERIEISEPVSVVVLRVCPKKLPAFLAGTRRDGRLIWTHHNHLACVFNREDGEKVSKRLEEQGIPNFVLPASEVRHGSL
jgi:hypothetical protein